MSVRPTDSGKWVIDYYDATGRRVRRVHDAPDRASAELIERALACIDSGPPEITGQSLTVSALFPDYIDACRTAKRPRTVTDIERTYNAHLARLLGSLRLSELTPAHLRHYKAVRGLERVIRGFEAKGRGTKKRIIMNRLVSPRTINKELAYLSGFLKWCRRDLNLTLQPVHFDNLRATRPVPIVLTPDEVRRIIDAADPVRRALILCLYTMGLRLSEATGLRWENVDLQSDTIRVVQKGGTWKALPLNQWAKKAIERLDRNGPYVFPGKDKEKPVRDFRRALATICKRAGVARHVTPHLFRHSIATHLMGDGANLRTIQRYLGHSQLSTTTWYTHVDVGHLRDASRATLDAVMTKPTSARPGIPGVVTRKNGKK